VFDEELTAMPVTRADILKFLENQARYPLSARDLLGHFRLRRSERQAAIRLLEAMVEEGSLVRLRGDRFSLPRQVNLRVGTISVHRDGYGFVTPADGGEDVFVPARFVREAMDGDRVAVRVERGWKSGKQEGRIVRILERAHLTLVGRYEAGQRFGYVVPIDPRLTHDIFIPPGAALNARSGQTVVARIDIYPERNRNPEGTIIEILGEPDDPEVEILTIVHKQGLPYRFPAETLQQAGEVPDRVVEGDLVGREDLRDLTVVTIDGETARDFDDAVAVSMESGGRIRLWVSIADVGHYVAEGCPLDKEAFERSTSVYFPGRCIPMLPESLSNGICSLNPGVDRLTLTAEMVFDRQGARVASRFYPSAIRSRARLTYTEVRDMVVNMDQAVIDRFPEVFRHLEVMKELALQLTAMRRRRGSLDFDLPEAEVVLDLRGRPEDIVRSERTLAHRMIEEFMLAANEAVADFLAGRKAPLLYRVHEPPDLEKLQAFQEFITHFNYGPLLGNTGIEAGRLQALLTQAEGKPEERMINEVLLRSMKQARYSAENVGHFGLAADRYCHFTSPIRRYPDLVVHRVLRKVLKPGGLSEKEKERLNRILPEMGETTSRRERRAMEAEREIVNLKKCQFMADKVGDEFSGFVSGVQAFGFFVELKDVFVEGLVRVSTLTDDFYHFEEDLHRLYGTNSRKIFQVGDEVRVKVAEVNLERREINFLLADLAGAALSEGQRKRKR
jgi:ribonuclease R